MNKCTCPPPGPFTPMADYHCPLHGGKAVDGFEVEVAFGKPKPGMKRLFGSDDFERAKKRS